MLLLQVNAQNNTYYNRMQHVFGNIDKAKVTTGYLKEFGIRFNTIEDYDGVLDTLNYVDKLQWKNLYSSLYTMRVGTSAQNMTSTNTVFNNLNSQQQNDTINILLAMQHYQYQQYKNNALSNGDVAISNDRIYDVAGRNPYDTKNIFAITPLKKLLQGDTFSFKMPSNLIYSNTGLTISQIQVDFDNGQGYQTLNLDTNINVNYNSGGVKEIKYKITYTNNTIIYSHSKILLNYIPSQNYQARYSGFGTGIIRKTITGNGWNGDSAKGFVTVELAPGHAQITKPLIIVEGFDPNNSYNYYNLIYNFDLFSESTGTLDIKINASGLTLNQAIENEGYDLVFVDYANGTDYIQRNAYMLEKVIKWVNTEKNKNNNPNAEQNVVLGMSMGGLVARYALRHMEIDGDPNTNHDTKLYISHDTPHQGANVPLGLQAMARHLYGEQISLPVFFSLFDVNIVNLNDVVDGLEDGYNLLESPAAQQMLYYQLDGVGTNINHTVNALSTSFYNEYHSMGNPTQGGIKNIVIANGSECGDPLNFAVNSDIINYSSHIELSYFTSNILFTFLNALSLNPLKVVSSILSTDNDIYTVFNVKALPNQEVKQIYNGDIYIKKTILFAITIHEQLMDDKKFYSQSSMLPLDNASGGIYDIDNFAKLPSNLNSSIVQRRFSFIPTFSSLNIGGGNQTIQYADLNKSYSPLSPPLAPKNVPFDNFYSNVLSNENHIQFTLNNGNWLLDELKGNIAFKSCASNCSSNLPLKINGANQVCNNSTSNYYVNNINSQATINWSISPNGGFSITTNTDKSVTITPNGNFGGIATLTAEITTDCNTSSYTVTKEVQTGAERPIKYDISGNEINTYNFPTLYWHDIVYGHSPGTLEWEWNIGYGNFSLQAGNTSYARVFSSFPTFGVLEVRKRDACGWSPKTLIVLNLSDGTGGGLRFSAYPNPATSTLNVTEKDKKPKKVKTKNSSSISMFDFRGNLIKKLNSSSGQLNLNGLKKGHYILLIKEDEYTEKHHIIIE